MKKSPSTPLPVLIRFPNDKGESSVLLMQRADGTFTVPTAPSLAAPPAVGSFIQDQVGMKCRPDSIVLMFKSGSGVFQMRTNWAHVSVFSKPLAAGIAAIRLVTEAEALTMCNAGLLEPLAANACAILLVKD
jgi:hypothetical protein